MWLNNEFDPNEVLSDAPEWGEPSILTLVEFGTMSVHTLAIYEVYDSTLIFRKQDDKVLVGPFDTVAEAVYGILY